MRYGGETAVGVFIVLPFSRSLPFWPPPTFPLRGRQLFPPIFAQSRKSKLDELASPRKRDKKVSREKKVYRPKCRVVHAWAKTISVAQVCLENRSHSLVLSRPSRFPSAHFYLASSWAQETSRIKESGIRIPISMLRPDCVCSCEHGCKDIHTKRLDSRSHSTYEFVEVETKNIK